jgi:nucleoside-diphosphate-sugar epimerase
MILITGGSGFIGSHFHNYLENNEIINFDQKKPNFTCKSTYLEGDIRKKEDLDIVSQKFEISNIIHLAAVHFDFQSNFHDANVNGTKNIIEFAENNNINKIIFYSSVAVYGYVTKETDENTPPNPNIYYGKSKLEAEHLLIDWANKSKNRKLIIIRPTVVYGPNNFGNVFNLIRQIKSGFAPIIGKGNNVKSIAYVENLVLATLEISKQIKDRVKIYNYVDYPQYTTKELSKLIANKLNKKSVFRIPYKLALFLAIPFDIISYILGKDLPISRMRIKKFCSPTYFLADKIRSDGFTQKYSPEEGIEKTIHWINSIDPKKEYKNWKKQFK